MLYYLYCTCNWLHVWANNYRLVHYSYIAISNLLSWLLVSLLFIAFSTSFLKFEFLYILYTQHLKVQLVAYMVMYVSGKVWETILPVLSKSTKMYYQSLCLLIMEMDSHCIYEINILTSYWHLDIYTKQSFSFDCGII